MNCGKASAASAAETGDDARTCTSTSTSTSIATCGIDDAGCKTRAEVSNYYGKELTNSCDLKTNACGLAKAPVAAHKKILARIHEEVLSKFYGCGSPIPDALEGCVVLDLGCGTGRDSYVCSALVGPSGRVIGVDMTDQQLEVARRHVDFHTRAFGYAAPNVDFRKGIIEDLRSAGIADGSVDVVISNCVINLCADKQKVFDEIARVLKPGGELYFSDMYTDRRVPPAIREDAVMFGEGLGGALYVEDFRRMMARAGFPDVRVVRSSRITIYDEEMKRKVGPAQYWSKTVRAFKVASLEDRCEGFGQTAAYKGSLPDLPEAFVLDGRHTFPAGAAVPVCGNAAESLSHSRFAPHFVVTPRGPHTGTLAGCCAGGIAEADGAAPASCGGGAPAAACGVPAAASCCGGAPAAASCCGGAQAAASCCGGAPAAASCCGGAPAAASCCGGAPAAASCCGGAPAAASCCGGAPAAASCCGGAPAAASCCGDGGAPAAKACGAGACGGGACC